ncbi:683_t:CDS:10, partial [Acaulospora morrowiae]
MTQTENTGAKLNFLEDELILCFHGPLLYEAKILKAESWGPTDSESGEVGPHYFVHYKGWKKTWDEWVPEERIVKYNDANLARQKQLKETYSNKKKKLVVKDRPIANVQESSENSINNESEQNESPKSEDASVKLEDQEIKNAEDDQKETESENMEGNQKYMNRLEIRISMPESLKCRLIDDWENVTKNHSLLKLPRTPNVVEILNQYLDYKRKNVASNLSSSSKTEKGDIYTEVAHGIQVYFEKTLGNILLYGYERQQYVDIRKQYLEKENTEIYGAEHLLRLFVELPRLLAHSHLDKAATDTLEEHLEDFLKFLQKNEEQYFITEYERHGVQPAKKQRTTNEKKTYGYNVNNSEGWVCGNCGTSNTPGWRAGETPDQKLCNACGLYYAKYKSHRPSSLWNNHR